MRGLMRRGHFALALLGIAAACNPPSTAAATAQPAAERPIPAHDEPTTPAAPVTAASPSPGAPSDVPADEPALAPAAAPAPAPVDVRTADGVVELVRRICERAAAGDAQWVQAHVALPLPGNELVNENGGDPLLGSRLDTDATSLARLAICRDPPAHGSALQSLTIDAERVTAVIAIEGFDHRLVFALASAAEPRLVALDFVVPRVPLPRVRKKAPRHLVHGWVKKATDGFAGIVELSLLRELERRPACIRQHFARSNISVSLGVAVSKVDGQEAQVRVYASTVAPASLLGCLETQLGKAVASVFRGVPFEVDYHLMLGVPVSEDELGDSDAVIMSDE
jgi:hypothetical protein